MLCSVGRAAHLAQTDCLDGIASRCPVPAARIVFPDDPRHRPLGQRTACCDRRRHPHPVRACRHGSPDPLRDRARPPLCGGADPAHGDRRRGGRPAGVRNRGTVGAGPEHRARSFADSAPAQGRAVLERVTRLRVRQPGDHRCRRPDPPRSCRLRDCRRRRVIVGSTDPALPRLLRRARRGVESQEPRRPGAGAVAHPSPRPRPHHAGDCRADDGRNDGAVSGEDGEDQPHRPRGSGPVRVAFASPCACRHH